MTTPEAKLLQLLQDYPAHEHRTASPLLSTSKFRYWFLSQFSSSSNALSLEDFALYFLNAIRQYTEPHLRSNESETPKCLTPVRTQKPQNAGIVTTQNAGGNGNGKLAPRRLPLTVFEPQESPCSPAFASTPEPRNYSRKDEATASFGQSMHSDSSTPVKRYNHGNNGRRSASSYQANTPVSNEKQSRNNSASSSLCLGDFMMISTPGNNRSHRKKTPQSQSQSQQQSVEKPKKRVVPTTISKHVSSGQGDAKTFGAHSSFSNENNILKLSHGEVEDKDKCSIMAARKTLKLNAIEISKELETSVQSERELREIIENKLVDVTAKVSEEAVGAPAMPCLPLVHLDEVTNRPTLDRLADIYAILIDLNFVTNILSELAFLLNLLNAQEQLPASMLRAVEQLQKVALTETDTKKEKSPSETESTTPTGFGCLATVTNCIYFALGVLQQQRHVLALLDSKSLGVVLNNERICTLSVDLKTFLEGVQQRKQQIDHQTASQDTFDAFLRLDKSFKSVYYQEDKDSRQHFVSNNEFAAFKTQRDLFYKALKLWESNHLNPTWNFAIELSPKIREIFKQSENAVNMAHFSKLFVSQLLIMASDATSPEEMGLDVDAQKFNKLTQRLVAPSNFSVDYQFPRNQSFFRDFISESRSIPFIEQLKMTLYSQLIALNNSSFEQLNIGSGDNDSCELESAQYENGEYIVRPEVLASMIILAKFLGFITAQPYNQNNSINMPAGVEKKQISLRSMFQPHINVCQLLQQAIKNNKLLIMLPWLVQFLVMLDNVTLQLTNFVETAQVLFALYAQMDTAHSQLTHTSVFIVRCCLGWLFENKPIIAEQYYQYRMTHKLQEGDVKTQDLREIRVLISDDVTSKLPAENALRIASVQSLPNGKYNCVLQQQLSQDRMLVKADREAKPTVDTCFNPMIESLLNVACPFLAEFRVSIMPAKYATTRYVSRTGRYRHITTRLAEPSTPTRNAISTKEPLTLPSPHKQQQQQLLEAFVHSQNGSMRRMIEFLIERTYKSVVKDAQHIFLLPSKVIADNKVNEITSADTQEVFQLVSSIYNDTLKEARNQWQAEVPKMLDERIERALDALLPLETAPIIRQTYFLLIRRSAKHKVEQWYAANMLKGNFYCQNLSEVTEKICKANKRERQTNASTELKIVKLKPSVSDLLDDLQYWLHCTSTRTELVTSKEPLVAYLQDLRRSFENTLPTVFYRLVGAGIVQLLQHLVTRLPAFITKELVQAACDVCQHSNMKSAVASKKDNKKKDDNEEQRDNSESTTSSTPSIFEGLVTIAFIESLGDCHARYEKLQQLLTMMIEEHVLSVDEVNVLFMPVFKHDWPVPVLNEISGVLQAVAKDTAKVRSARDNDQDKEDEAKSHLFMEVLADLSRDVDDF